MCVVPFILLVMVKWWLLGERLYLCIALGSKCLCRIRREWQWGKFIAPKSSKLCEDRAYSMTVSLYQLLTNHLLGTVYMHRFLYFQRNRIGEFSLRYKNRVLNQLWNPWSTLDEAWRMIVLLTHIMWNSSTGVFPLFWESFPLENVHPTVWSSTPLFHCRPAH